MDDDTITLTPALRAQMADALDEAAENRLHGDHAGYRATLNATPDGTVIDGDHPLADVLTYFGIHDF